MLRFQRLSTFTVALAAVLSSAVLCATSVHAQTPRGEYGPTPPPPSADDDGSRPEIDVLQTKFNFGKVRQGEPVEHAFEVMNRGDAVLRINKVKPGCGCTTEKFDSTIAPGETGEVRLSLDTTKLRGKPTKWAEIYSNDPKNPRTRITLTGEILTFFEWEPRSIRMSGLVGTPLSATAVATAQTDRPFTVKSVSTTRGNVEITGHRVEEGKQIIVDLAAEARGPALTPVRDSLTVLIEFTDDGTEHKLNAAISAQHRARVHMPVRQAYFLQRETQRLKMAPDAPITKTLVVEAGGEGIEFEIEELRLEGLPENAFEASFRTIESGRRYLVEVRLVNYVENEKFLRGSLKIMTNDPSTPMVEAAISAQFTSRARAPRRGAGAKKPASGKRNERGQQTKSATGLRRSGGDR